MIIDENRLIIYYVSQDFRANSIFLINRWHVYFTCAYLPFQNEVFQLTSTCSPFTYLEQKAFRNWPFQLAIFWDVLHTYLAKVFRIEGVSSTVEKRVRTAL